MRQLTLAALLAGGLILGCGPAAKPSGRLQGTVTFDGAPVKDASFQLHSMTTGEAFAAKVDGSGKFAFDTPVTVGEYKAAVIPSVEMPVAGAGGPSAKPGKPPERKDIPERYRTTTKNELKVDVKPGNNTFDAKLTK